MRKFGIRLPILCVLIFLVGVTALATVVGKISSLENTGGNVTVALLSPGAEDPVKFTVTSQKAVKDKKYLLVIRKGEAPDANDPTKDVENLVYMGMEKADKDGNVQLFSNAYPKEMDGGTYYVYMSDYGTNKLEKVATFNVAGGSNPVKLGFVVNQDSEDITANDALAALYISVGKPQDNGQAWTEAQRIAANVDGDKDVTANDALWILERSVGKRDANWNEVG